MGKKDKLIERFKRQPNDFTFDELVKLFAIFGFLLNENYSGSRVKFENKARNLQYRVHKPHPSNIVKKYVLKQVAEMLKTNKFI